MIAIPTLADVDTKLKDTWAQLTEIFVVEHDEDGHHTDITANSLTLTPNTDTGATGNATVGGSGTFNGNVTADADGTITNGPVVIGAHAAVGSVRAGPGIDIQHPTARWRIVPFDPGSSDRELLFQDVAGGAPFTAVLKWRNAISAYVLHPDTSGLFNLGLEGPGTRINEIHGLTLKILTLLSNAGSEIQSGVLSPAQITANQNDYAPTGITGAIRHLRLSTDASRTLTGLTNTTSGNVLTLWNVGAQDLVLAHESASSTAAMRFLCPGAANLTLQTMDSVALWYDSVSSRWRIQGF